jgi:hypothetical protein
MVAICQSLVIREVSKGKRPRLLTRELVEFRVAMAVS